MIDTHCHLTHHKFQADAAEVLGRIETNLKAAITIGTGIEDGQAVQALCEQHPGLIFGTCGLDPFTSHKLGDQFEDALQQLEALHRSFHFVAVGEIGLDYHYDLDEKPIQRKKFEAQLALAEQLGRPVVIHVREAHEDMAAVLADHPNVSGVIHSFTAGPQEAETYLALGWSLAFNGVATFKKTTEVREAAKLTPPDKLLLETDSPYLAPVPFRGKRCEPIWVEHVAATLAETRETSIEKVERLTDQNAIRLFGLELA